MTFPIRHSDGTRDTRYEVNLEWCGQKQQMHVLRFCGDYVGTFRNLADATLRATGHRNARLGNIIEEVKP